MSPWKKWLEYTPSWWDIYNKVKHTRTKTVNGIESFKQANQINVLLAFSALYQLEMYFYKEINQRRTVAKKINIPIPQSQYFRIKNWPDNIELIDNKLAIYMDGDCLYMETAD